VGNKASPETLSGHLLGVDECAEALLTLPAWSLAGDGLSISRKFSFEDFTRAFAFMTAVAIEAGSLNHHPDWSNSYATVKVTLSTHSAGGLSDLDFALARRMDLLALSRR
jgi:4a-hydroxytetrahydrobiopterin dehydratase